MKMSWRVLMQDRELILFPIFAGTSLLALSGVFLGIGATTGTVDRLSDAGSAGGSAGTVDYVLGAASLFCAYFIVIFFNVGLVAAAMERLRGGDPTVRSGLAKASSHIPAIIGWAAISATVGLILQALRDRADNNILGQIAVSIAGGAWAYMTFFVVPVLVAEGIGPISAIKRSGALFRQTWGRQATAAFGFGLVYIVAMLIAFLPAALIYTVAPVAGLIVGVFSVALAMGAVAAMEGIFKAALYNFATGAPSEVFDQGTLRSAYRAL